MRIVGEDADLRAQFDALCEAVLAFSEADKRALSLEGVVTDAMVTRWRQTKAMMLALARAWRDG